jgi:hypothetical protein
MAQVTVSDELYVSLFAISRERGSTPDQLVSALIELLVREDQLAFWGEGIVKTYSVRWPRRSNPRGISAQRSFLLSSTPQALPDERLAGSREQCDRLAEGSRDAIGRNL